MGDGGARPEAPRLVAPAAQYHASFLTALAEYQGEERHLELDLARMADPAEFARHVAALRAAVTDPEAPDRYVLSTFGVWPAAQQPETYVPQTVLWWAAGPEYLGRINIRHHLNEGLRMHGGNIGYEVRPGARGRGHATAMLAAALPLAAALGIAPALIDCDADNLASRRVIEKNGGVLVREEREAVFFLVPTR